MRRKNAFSIHVIIEIMNMKKASNNDSCTQFNCVNRAQSTLSVSAVDYYLNLPVVQSPPSPAISTVTLTPGRIRNIDQDMQALRASRQDNPFIKQVIASRESLADCIDEIESDDTNLMSQEFPTDLDIDPLTLPEMHEHMIRSPPPTNWPKSPNHRFFQFPTNEETLHVEVMTKEKAKKHVAGWQENSPVRSSLPKPYQERFSLLTTSGVLRTTGDDSIRLMSTTDD